MRLRQSAKQRKQLQMALSDEQLAKRLLNLATDAHLSGNYLAHLWLSQAAARIMELANCWHPSMGHSDGVDLGEWETGR